MLKRKQYEKLREWKLSSQGRTALLIEGARRVGKSTLAEEFARTEYDSYMLIDFSVAHKEVKQAFIDHTNDFDSLFLFLQSYYRVSLTPRKSLVIFDEVQHFPKARELIKHLVKDGRYDYIETGSLISIKKNVAGILIPSEEDKLLLNPLDFEEFLWALGEENLAQFIRNSFEKCESLPDGLHRKAMMLWREYILVGGMPQVVNAYIDGKNMESADEEKRRILGLYRDDIAKFADGERGRVSAIFDEIPGQLSKHEKKFILSTLSPHARSREYSGSFFWLADACITNNCFNATNPTVGLALSQENTTLKCYMADTGLLVSHTFADREVTPQEVYRDILLGKLEVNEGMLVENAVAQQLRASGHRLFFYSRSGAGGEERMEIDFLIAKEYDDAAMRLRISPIEVKAGKGRYATASLDRFAATYTSRIGTQYILHVKQLRVENKRVYLPLYMTHCL
ncbi:MAG: ATP-binding protein [Actinomycetaceae bacterium]|nr:ATP-binding protein [Actinomycetaceae bacterium]